MVDMTTPADLSQITDSTTRLMARLELNAAETARVRAVCERNRWIEPRVLADVRLADQQASDELIAFKVIVDLLNADSAAR